MATISSVRNAKNAKAAKPANNVVFSGTAVAAQKFFDSNKSSTIFVGFQHAINVPYAEKVAVELPDSEAAAMFALITDERRSVLFLKSDACTIHAVKDCSWPHGLCYFTEAVADDGLVAYRNYFVFCQDATKPAGTGQLVRFSGHVIEQYFGTEH